MSRIHVVADSDSRWKWGASLATRLLTDESTGSEIVGHLLQGRATPTQRQVADVGVDEYPLRRIGLGALVSDADVADGDVVVLACVGGTIQSAMRGFAQAWSGRVARPVVVTGYVGLVYERLVDGLLLRAGADVVLANSGLDAQRFREVYTAVGADADSVVQTALPFLGGERYDAGPVRRGERPLTVCFVSQPTVPGRRNERRYALERAVAHALAHPERRVLVKLRARPGEHTTHIERHHFSRLLPQADIPANVSFVYGAMADTLDLTDLCVTVSSTAALESLHRGIPTAVLTDFGIRESLGNHIFLGSGLLTSWSALDAGEVPTADTGWMAMNGVADSDPYTAVHERVQKLVAQRDWLPELQPWYDADAAAGYLPHLLRRNGLDLDGAALVAPDGATVAARTRQRLAHRAASQAYRLSLTHIEPVLRKWAQL